MRALLPLLAYLLTVAFARAADDAAPAPELTILSASYGVDEERVEVAGLLNPLVARGALLLRAPWGFDPDPKPGVVKNVRISFKFNGIQRNATFTQRQDILLPGVRPGFTILNATYGIEHQRIDITELVRSAVADESLRRPAKWSFGRVDPASGKIKTVEITYVHNGAIQTAVFSQRQPIELPPPREELER